MIHPGAHVGSGEAAGFERGAQALDRAFEATAECPVMIDLDTTAGQGTCLGRDGRVLVEQDADGTLWIGGAVHTRIVGEIDL